MADDADRLDATDALAWELFQREQKQRRAAAESRPVLTHCDECGNELPEARQRMRAVLCVECKQMEERGLL